jgi:hypothetical protein
VSDNQHRLDEHEEALNALALLCGSLIRALTHQRQMTAEDVEELMRGLEASAERKSVLLTGLLEQVRWAAKWHRDPAEPRSVGAEDEARGGHEAPGGPGPTVPGLEPR